MSDTIHPFAAVTYSYDSNLLRLPDNPPGVDIEQSDNLKAVVAGVSFERPVGRQLFTGSARVSRVTFDRYQELDYNGKDANINWQWVWGNHLSGNIGGSYSQTLTPFSDFHDSERNLRVQRSQYAEGAWRFLSSWQVRGRVNHDEFTYDLASQRYLDRIENTSVLGFDYLGANGSTIGLQASKLRGNYPNPLSFGQFVFDQGYTQEQLQLKVLWHYSDVSQVEFLGGRARRKHTQFTERDASGTNGRVTAYWMPLASVRFNGSAWREFAAFEGGTASYSLNKGVSVGAVWNVTAKIQAEAKCRVERRTFPGLIGAGEPLDGQDSSRTGTLSVTYLPTSTIQLILSGTHDVRSASSFISSGYRSNGASLTASAQF